MMQQQGAHTRERASGTAKSKGGIWGRTCIALEHHVRGECRRDGKGLRWSWWRRCTAGGPIGTREHVPIPAVALRTAAITWIAEPVKCWQRQVATLNHAVNAYSAVTNRNATLCDLVSSNMSNISCVGQQRRRSDVCRDISCVGEATCAMKVDAALARQYSGSGCPLVFKWPSLNPVQQQQVAVLTNTIVY
jgi:hypothetical protein